MARKSIISIILLLAIAGLVYFIYQQSTKTPTFSPPPKTPPITSPQPQPLTDALYCPEPETLEKQGLWWQAPDGWKDYSQSFVKNIAYFQEAQWVGVKVGKIICLYKGKEAATFPVALEKIHPLVVIEPTQGLWRSAEQIGYKRCTSNNVKDCPFFVTKKINDQSDIYQSITYQGTNNE